MILTSITKKQKEIPLNLYRFRFLNSKHIQRLLNNKDPRNTNAWLKYLTAQDYICCIQQENTFPRKPNVYRLSKNGIRFLKLQPNCEKAYITKLYQEDRRSEQFQLRCMLIADTYLALKEKYISLKTTFKFYAQADFPKKGVIKDINPSFAYILETKSKIQYYYCELFKIDMPWGAISGRIDRYFAYYGEEEDDTTIVFICPDARTYRSVRRYTRKLMREQEFNENLKIFQTTYERIRRADLGERIEIIN